MWRILFELRRGDRCSTAVSQMEEVEEAYVCLALLPLIRSASPIYWLCHAPPQKKRLLCVFSLPITAPPFLTGFSSSCGSLLFFYFAFFVRIMTCDTLACFFFGCFFADSWMQFFNAAFFRFTECSAIMC